MVLVKRKVGYQYIHGRSFKVYFYFNSSAKALSGVCFIKMDIWTDRVDRKYRVVFMHHFLYCFETKILLFKIKDIYYNDMYNLQDVLHDQ